MTVQDTSRAGAATPMPASANLELNLALAQRLAWLLRSDVRKGKASGDAPNEGPAQWWLIQGRSEYPYLSYLSDAQKLALFVSAGKMAVGW